MAFSARGNAQRPPNFVDLRTLFPLYSLSCLVTRMGELLFIETQRIVGVPVFCLACCLMKQSGTFLEESYEFDDQRSSS